MFAFDDPKHHGPPARGASLPRQAFAGSPTPIFDRLMEEWQRMFRAVPGDRYGEGSGVPGFGPEGVEGFHGFDNFDGYGGFDGFDGYDGFDAARHRPSAARSDGGGPPARSAEVGRGGPPALSPVSGRPEAGRPPTR